MTRMSDPTDEVILNKDLAKKILDRIESYGKASFVNGFMCGIAIGLINGYVICALKRALSTA
jgi:hypothetical protein